jgi:hypothetical protein
MIARGRSEKGLVFKLVSANFLNTKAQSHRGRYKENLCTQGGIEKNVSVPLCLINGLSRHFDEE